MNNAYCSLRTQTLLAHQQNTKIYTITVKFSQITSIALHI